MVGKSVASFFGRHPRVGKTMLGAGIFGAAAQGLYSGATNDGQLTNNFLEVTLGTPDIDNEVFGEDMGLLTDFKYSQMGKAVAVSKYGGGTLGALAGGSSAYLLGRGMSKSKHMGVRALGSVFKYAGTPIAAAAGGVGGYVGGSLAPLTQHVGSPLRQDYFNTRVRSQMPTVPGDIVFGAYNQR